MHNRIVAGILNVAWITRALLPLALLPFALAPAQADNFPSRPITLIVPFPPGGSTDVAARIMADKMGAALGQPVIVENVGGAPAARSASAGSRARRPTATRSISASGTPMSAASSTISVSICAATLRRLD
jgi:tripartite-type tricarboxylate transporter receptor subunit TctC